MAIVTKALLLLLLCICAHAERIICIGDSITQGGARADDYSYRLPLQSMVKADFIGTQHAGLDPSMKWPDGFDPDHEGYYGATTAQVRERLKESLPKLPAPDIALIYLGTNDRPGETVGPLEEIVGELRAKNPMVRVYIGLLPGDGWRRVVSRLLVRGMASRLRVAAVPPSYGKADTYDGVHPNPSGQMKMARAWYAALTG